MITMSEDLMRDFPEADALFRDTGKHILDFIGPDYHLLIGRSIVTKLDDLKPCARMLVMNEIMDFIEVLLKADQAFCRFSASIFMKLFLDFLPCEKFVAVSKVIADINPDFRRELNRRYENMTITKENALIVPALVQILNEYTTISQSGCLASRGCLPHMQSNARCTRPRD